MEFSSPNAMLFDENPRDTQILEDVYQWFNHDNGEIVISDHGWTFWIEKTWSGADYANQKVFAKIKQLMKKHYNCEYLYDKYPN